MIKLLGALFSLVCFGMAAVNAALIFIFPSNPEWVHTFNAAGAIICFACGVGIIKLAFTTL